MSSHTDNKEIIADDSVESLRERLLGMQQRLSDYPLQHALLARLAVLVEKRMVEVCATVLKPYGITYPMYQALVLSYAVCDRPMTPTELARGTGERTTNITHICDELERRDLITRRQDPSDRRRVVIELTEEGETMLYRLQQQVWDIWKHRYDGQDAAALDQLESSLINQLRNLEDAVASTTETA